MSARRRPLTEKQQTVYDLHEKEGKSFREIAAMLGRGETTISECYKVACQKLAGGRVENKGQQPIESTLPAERAAELIDKVTDPFARLVDVAKECGIRPSVVEGLAKRMRTRYQGVASEMRAVKTKELVHKLDERINHAIGYMDDYIMGEASFRDLAMGTAQLIEKRQLLKGEPTQIISVDERRTLNELVPLLVREAQRRGITIEGESRDVTPRALLVESNAQPVA